MAENWSDTRDTCSCWTFRRSSPDRVCRFLHGRVGGPVHDLPAEQQGNRPPGPAEPPGVPGRYGRPGPVAETRKVPGPQTNGQGVISALDATDGAGTERVEGAVGQRRLPERFGLVDLSGLAVWLLDV